MKIGIRKPNYKKRLKARTTGKVKRKVKKAITPGYGKKGTGWIKNPKKAAYNKVYNRTTVSVDHLAKPSRSHKKKPSTTTAATTTAKYTVKTQTPAEPDPLWKQHFLAVVFLILGIIIAINGLLNASFSLIIGIVFFIIGAVLTSDGEDSKDEAETISDVSAPVTDETAADICPITIDDMMQFNFSRYQMTEVISYRGMSIMPITSGQNHQQAIDDLLYLNNFVKEALSLAHLDVDLNLDSTQIKFSSWTRPSGDIEYSVYFECTPYTPTRKLSKYPLILHYSTADINPVFSYFGEIYYMRDGSIGKARMIFWLDHTLYVIELAIRDGALCVRKFSRTKDNISDTLYKI